MRNWLRIRAYIYCLYVYEELNDYFRETNTSPHEYLQAIRCAAINGLIAEIEDKQSKELKEVK